MYLLCLIVVGSHMVFFDCTRLLQEYQQHACAVRSVVFLSDGALVYTAAEDGQICVYDCNHGFAPIKMASSGFPRGQYVLLLLLLLL